MAGHSLDGMSNLAVIGAGVIGAALADRFVRSGARVTVIDSGRPGDGTTGTSFAWLNSYHKLPRPYHDLSVRGMREWARLGAEFEHPPWYRPTGNVRWAETDEQRAVLTERLDRLRDWGYPAQELTVRQLADLEPALRAPADAQIALFPGEGFVHGRQAAEALLARAGSAGARLVLGAGDVALEASDGQVRAVRLPDGTRVEADLYVCCTGWRTPGLLQPLGVPVDLVPGDAPGSTAPCLVVDTDGPAPVSRVVHTPAVNVRPGWAGGVVLESGDINELVDGRTPPDELDRLGRVLVRRGEQLLAGFSAPAVRRTVCVRPLPVDGHPIVGWLPQLRNVYLAVSHSGITLAPVLAELVDTDLRQGADELTPYRPARFAGAGH
jgi:glycine/D-amino acid oxidase-like deaminating enzyme